MLKLVMVLVTCFGFCGGSALGQGWTDFEIDLGDGYEFVRPNACENFILRRGVVAISGGSEAAGPIVWYAITPRYIYTWHAGRRGDCGVDSTQSHYMLYDKEQRSAVGPLTHEVFLQRVGGAEPAWVEPVNPSAPDRSWELSAWGAAGIVAALVVTGVAVVVVMMKLGRVAR